MNGLISTPIFNVNIYEIFLGHSCQLDYCCTEDRILFNVRYFPCPNKYMLTEVETCKF